jgi:5-oxoprolinase (ATP-hydrolysing)
MQVVKERLSSLIDVWCDVGGTFTDCFVVLSDGRRLATKVLSNGVVKGRVERQEGSGCWIDKARALEPNGFWDNATIRWIDDLGQPISESRCIEHNAIDGRLRTASAIPIDRFTSIRPTSFSYELIAGVEAPVLATRLLLGVPLNQSLPPLNVRLGTTRGTNALLTRRGAKTALLVTRGFRDLLQIGYQERPDLFSLHIQKREPLYDVVAEVNERLSADGAVLRSLDIAQVQSTLQELQKRGIRSIAICLMHSYRNPQHEWLVEQLARDAGFREISTSSEVAPLIKVVSRAETTVVDAYLGPVVRDYLDRVAEQFGNMNDSTLRVMTSHGGLVNRSTYRGKDCVLSGPAGGAVALTKLAFAAGYHCAIGLDMGGTSTDVCRIAGTPTIEHESIKAGVRLMTPMLAIHTVAAGGGSICTYDGVQWRVGPQSAGADPGPACYGRGGPLTVTDLNVLLGRVVPEAFPLPLNLPAARSRLTELLQQAHLMNDDSHAESLAAGLRRIANEHMAAAVKSISIAQGADPRSHALVGFGGAAGQHICEIADILKMETILDPPNAGLLSAFGMGCASISRWVARSLYQPLSTIESPSFESHFQQLEIDGLNKLAEERIDTSHVRHVRSIEMRYLGTDQPIAVHSVDDQDLEAKFATIHRQRFGYDRSGRAIEVVALRVESIAETSHPMSPILACDRVDCELPAKSHHRVFSMGAWHDGWIVERKMLVGGHRLEGPGIVLSEGSTTVVDVGWSMEVLSDRTLRLCRTHRSEVQESVKLIDPILREVLAQRLAAIADSMGIVLEQTAISVNVKERRDYSCAVFAANGDLIANAPHVPVHLGAMSETVRKMIELFPAMKNGDCFITNDPYSGGSHLPDVTVITPVFSKAGERIFFTASRAHHAEIGGLAPGSMSPLTTCLEEEGVIIPAMHLVEAGQDRSEEVQRLLASARYASRSIQENMADITAQQAANRRGEGFLLELVEEYSWRVIEAYLEQIQSASEAKVKRWIETYGTQRLSFVDSMDDGTPIAACLAFDNGRLTIDLTGTGSISKSNLNANPAIVTAAVMYVVRTMIDDELPLNSGALRPIQLIIPTGLLNPFQSSRSLETQPAVAAGNVETSQRVVDCLLGALGVAGASQGTMNNLLMGNAKFGYYETIGGGSGATEQANGADAVHTHMTNTRLTDPEILESRYPVQLTCFAIRTGSGGSGRYHGGNGIHREMLLLEDLDVSLVTSRRGDHQPYGMAGGKNGLSGENYRIGLDGNFERLPATCQIKLKAGERIGLKTPGGGGFGIATGV